MTGPARGSGSTAGRRLDRLTRRERQVLELVASGLSPVAVADQLHLRPATVERVCTRVFARHGLASPQQHDPRVLAVLVLLREG